MAPPKERKTTLEPPNTAPGALPEPPKNAPGASPDATCSPRGRREPSRASCRPPERAFRHLFGTISTSLGILFQLFFNHCRWRLAGVWCWPLCLSCCWRFTLCAASGAFSSAFLFATFWCPIQRQKRQRNNERTRARVCSAGPQTWVGGTPEGYTILIEFDFF